jgi:hypothetical protein
MLCGDMSERATKSNSKPVLIYIPKRWMPRLDAAVSALDLDRTKFVRHAIREKLIRHGVKLELN